MKYVVGDIHGCLNTLKALITQLNLSDGDTIVFVGDYINKGPNSTGVIDFILKLGLEGYDVVTLKGNHEDDLLQCSSRLSTLEFHTYVEEKQGNADMLEDGKIKEPYLGFMQRLAYYWMDEHFVVAHAGLNLQSENPLNDKDALLRIRKFGHGQQGYDGKRIVHGHDPTDLQAIKTAATDKAWIIPLDAGCVYNKVVPGYEQFEFGHLCALELETMKLFVQPNIEN